MQELAQTDEQNHPAATATTSPASEEEDALDTLQAEAANAEMGTVLELEERWHLEGASSKLLELAKLRASHHALSTEGAQSENLHDNLASGASLADPASSSLASSTAPPRQAAELATCSSTSCSTTRTA